MPITKEMIFQVADEFDSNGLNPTLSAVRKKIGGGSFSTISEAMKEWRSGKASKVISYREPVPPAISERLADFGGELWNISLEMANGRLAAEREAIDALRIGLESERSDAVQLADQVTAELETLQGRIAAYEATEKAARQEIASMKEQAAAFTERAVTAEARADELGKRVEDLNRELSRVNIQNGELLKTLTDSVGRRKRSKKEETNQTAPEGEKDLFNS
jgi:septal ring factor EnvC (AmiA/AmiB activator)